MKSVLYLNKSFLNKLLIYMTIFFSLFTYVPFVNNINGVVYILIILLLIINYKNILITLFKFKLIILFDIVVFVYFGISKILLNDIVINDLYSLILFEVIFILFISVKNDSIDKNKILKIVSILSVILSSIIILYYRGNYVNAIKHIGENFYNEKNKLCPLLMSGNIYLLYLGLSNKKLRYIIFYFVGMFNLFMFNSRTNTVSSTIVSIIMIGYYVYRSKYRILYIAFIPTLLSGMAIIFKDYFMYYTIKFLKIDYFTSVISSYKYGLLDALTAGRVESYIYALKFFILSPILGTGFNKINIFSDPQSTVGVHNLWLRALLYGGILYFILILILIIYIIKIILKYKTDNKLIAFMLIAGLINSMFEPYAPLGPGTSYLIYWLIICANININIKI